MTRISLVQPEDMTADQRAQYERFPSNLTQALLITDRRLAQALPETANALRAAPLKPSLREAVILRVAALMSSAYERMQHLPQAEREGLTRQQVSVIEDVQRASSDSLSAEVVVVLQFVDALVGGSAICDAQFVGVRRVLSDRDLVTVILLVGHYMTVARLTSALELDLDETPDSFAAEH